MGFGEVSALIKVAFILVLVGLVVHLIGFATNYWQDYEGYARIGGYSVHVDRNSGLWKYCTTTRNQDTRCWSVRSAASWFEATQAFETLGFIAAIAALVLIILYIFVPQTSGKKIVFILSMLACFAAAGCIILGIIIYGSKVEHNLSWSFALCTIAGIIFGVSGILLLVDMLKR